MPWKKVAGFRDVAVHGYFRVDVKEVWRIVQQDVREYPPLTLDDIHASIAYAAELTREEVLLPISNLLP